MTYTGFVSSTNHYYAEHGAQYMLEHPAEWVNLETEENRAYSMGLAEYCARITGLELPKWYSILSGSKLPKLWYTTHALIMEKTSPGYKESVLEDAIPEFLKYNIVITEVGNAV